MLKTLSFSELSVAIYKNQRSPVDKSLILFEKRWDSTDFSFIIRGFNLEVQQNVV